MKYSIVDLGTLKVNAFEMIMGVSEDLIREHYEVDDQKQTRIGMQGLIVETGSKIIFFDPGEDYEEQDRARARQQVEAFRELSPTPPKG